MPEDDQVVEDIVEEEIIPDVQYNQSLRGVGGKFWITLNKGGDQKSSIAIHYVNTHLNINDDLFGVLETFREAFVEEDLNFEQILQRDINDFRVSTQMIPYILGSNQHIKGYDFHVNKPALFYPPIVCILMPFSTPGGKSTPEKYYNNHYHLPSHNSHPEWENWTIGTGKPGQKDVQADCVTLGGPGQENFRLWKPQKTNDARLGSTYLEFNTNRTKLIMIDGQHRGMSLLALYRNLKDKWDTTLKKKYEPFYAEWKPDHLAKFDLSELNLPMIVCVAPDCVEANDLDITEISRKIFLTLNKTAKTVSDSRTLLMNDTDLPAEFMRKFLERISDSSIADISSILREQKETSRVSNPLQFTSVESGIYPVFEDLILASVEETRDYANRRKNVKGNLARTKTLTKNLPHILCTAIDAKITRNSYSKQKANDLYALFSPLYVDPLIKITEDFGLISACTVKKSHEKIQSIELDHADMAIHNLWSGTRRGDIVDEYKKAVELKKRTLLRGGDYLNESLEKIDKIQKAENVFKECIISIQKENALSGIQYWEHISEDVVKSIFDLLREDMFVGALYLTFFDVVELCELENRDEQDLGPIVSGSERKENRIEAVKVYLDALNELFKPTDIEALDRLLQAFCGRSIKKNPDFDAGSEPSDSNRPFKVTKVKSWIGITWNKKEFDRFPHYSVLHNVIWHSYIRKKLETTDLPSEIKPLLTSIKKKLELWLDKGTLQAQIEHYNYLKKESEKLANDSGIDWIWSVDSQKTAAIKSINIISDALNKFSPGNTITEWLTTDDSKNARVAEIRTCEPNSGNTPIGEEE